MFPSTDLKSGDDRLRSERPLYPRALVGLPQTYFVCFRTSLRRTSGLCTMYAKTIFHNLFQALRNLKYSDFAVVHLVFSG